MLDEWLDRGIVALDEQGRINLLAAALTPVAGDDQFDHFGRNLHDHIAAAVANVTEDAPPYFERAVHYDRLSPESAAALLSFREQANQLLLSANRQALAVCDADSGGDHRWILGVYVYRAEEAPPSSRVENGQDEP